MKFKSQFSKSDSHLKKNCPILIYSQAKKEVNTANLITSKNIYRI